MIGSVTQQWQELADLAARRQAIAAGEILKADGGYASRGISEGPGEPVQPGHLEPEDLRRGYLEQGHAAESPQGEPARTPVLPPHGRGILTPVELPSTPAVAGHFGPMVHGLAQHQAQVTMRPPIPAGEA